jgi:hypothetical protein
MPSFPLVTAAAVMSQHLIEGSSRQDVGWMIA